MTSAEFIAREVCDAIDASGRLETRAAATARFMDEQDDVHRCAETLGATAVFVESGVQEADGEIEPGEWYNVETVAAEVDIGADTIEDCRRHVWSVAYPIDSSDSDGEGATSSTGPSPLSAALSIGVATLTTVTVASFVMRNLMQTSSTTVTIGGGQPPSLQAMLGFGLAFTVVISIAAWAVNGGLPPRIGGTLR